MPVLQLNDRSYPLNSGTNRVGGGSESEVQVAEDPSLGVQALIDVDGSGKAMMRRASDASSVRVNGVALGAEPTPLLHGDRVEIGVFELTFAEDEKGGATQFASAAEIADLVTKRAGGARATTATGGRMVSLVDGKEYTVAGEGIVIGREAGCDVVVPVAEVSRQHAEIKPDETGYLLFDHSTNGVFVNGERIEGSRRLARADVIRIGNEDFRFYADVAPAPPRISISQAKERTSGPASVAGSVDAAADSPPPASPVGQSPAAGSDTPAPPVPPEKPSAPPPAYREELTGEAVPPAAGRPDLGAVAPVAAAPPDTAPAPSAGAGANEPAGGLDAPPTGSEEVAPAAPRRPRPQVSPASDDSGTKIPAWVWLLVIVALAAVAGFILLSS
jgi:hypothetical protein